MFGFRIRQIHETQSDEPTRSSNSAELAVPRFVIPPFISYWPSYSLCLMLENNTPDSGFIRSRRTRPFIGDIPKKN